MAKKALQLASVASMIDQFNIPNIELMQSLGYHVDVVADFINPGTISDERSQELIKRLESMGVRVINIAVPRSLNPKAVFSAYKKVKNLVSTERYDLIHCHSPIGGAVARLAAKKSRKTGTRVIYTAHGFHFYDGAPLKNWIVFYPIEKFLSKYTDVLVTINKEDYKRASEKFYAKRTVYVPGVGIDTERFGGSNQGRKIRSELGIKDSDFMLLSVGELNDNKNHEIIIRALSKMKSDGMLQNNLFYIIVGKGDREERLRNIIMSTGLDHCVRLVGFRNDVSDFYDASDVFVFPSFREGLSVSLMEAMASGLPVICSKIRGNIDLINDKGGFFFDPANVDDVADSIRKILQCDRNAFGGYNLEKIKDFDKETVEKSIAEIYGGVSPAIS